MHLVCRISTAAKQSTVSDQTKLGKRQRQSGSRQPTAKLKQDIVYPVHCEVCNAELGIQDADEVVHFFHTFPSTA